MLAKWTTGGKSLKALSISYYLATSCGKEFGLLIPEKGQQTSLPAEGFPELSGQ